MSNEVAYSAISASDWLEGSAATKHIAHSRANFAMYSEEPVEMLQIHEQARVSTKVINAAPLEGEQAPIEVQPERELQGTRPTDITI
jgi:hypothetical protein